MPCSLEMEHVYTLQFTEKTPITTYLSTGTHKYDLHLVTFVETCLIET